MSYTKTITVDANFQTTVQRVRDALGEQGFGVLTEIDMKATLKAKIDADIEDYLVLGACNPPLAHKALSADRSVGALLPCNVVVRADGDRTIVDAMDPGVIGTLSDDAALAEVARDAAQRIDAALAAISDG